LPEKEKPHIFLLSLNKDTKFIRVLRKMVHCKQRISDQTQNISVNSLSERLPALEEGF
jgi:hypothetical protein